MSPTIFNFETFGGVHMKENEVNSEDEENFNGRKGEMTSNGI